MTLSSITSRQNYAGNGVTTVFAYNYRILAATDLLVTKRDSLGAQTTLTYGADYQVSGVGNSIGGSVTLTTALPSGYALTIRRVLPITQPTDIRNAGVYFPETHETQFDRLTMIDQQQQDSIGRSMQWPETVDPTVVSTTLPVPAANQALFVNAAATGLELRTVSTAAIALPGAGRTVSTLTAYLANNAFFNVRDYGALGDGVTNDTVAIQAAQTAAAAVNGTVLFPPGTYLGVGLTIDASVTWEGWGVVWLKMVTGQATQTKLVNVNTAFASSQLADVTIRNIGFDGNANITVYGLYARRTLRFSVENCKFKNFAANGLANPSYHIYASGYYANPTINYSQDTLVRGCSFSDSSLCDGVFLYYHDGAVVHGNRMRATGRGVYATGWIKRIAIIANEVAGCDDNGLRIGPDESAIALAAPSVIPNTPTITDVQGVLIVGNIVTTCAKDGIRATGNRVTVSGNTSIGNTLSGCQAVWAQDSTYTGNIFCGNANHGLMLARTTVTGWLAHAGVTISGNTCNDNTGRGILVEGGGASSSLLSKHVRVAQNIVARNGAAGISVWDGDDTCAVEGNTVYENGSVFDQAGIDGRVVLVNNAGGYLIRYNRCYDKQVGVAAHQAIGITLKAGGLNMVACRLIDNDCSDCPNTTVPGSFNGAAIRTTEGTGTHGNHILSGNMYRNCTAGVNQLAVTGGYLRATDIITETQETTGDLIFLGGYRQTIDGWYTDNVAISQTNVAMTRSAATGLSAKWIAPRAGSITAVAVKSNAARTNGTLTITVAKNAVNTGLSAVIDGTNTTFKATTVAKDTYTFVAGDEIETLVTTDGTWAPTTADIRASIEVET